MPIQQWSEDILVVDLADEPQFSEEMQALWDRLEQGGGMHVVLNLAAVRRMNSANIAELLRVRQKLIEQDRHLRVCSVPDSVWGVVMVAGLDKVFEFTPDVPSGLASLQLGSE